MTAPAIQPSFRIQRAILVPFAWTILFMLLVFVLSTQWMYQKQEESVLEQARGQIGGHLHHILQRDALEMAGMLQILARDGRVVNAFRTGRRDPLLAETRSLFNFLEGRLRITHLYFMTPRREVFLRVHKPERHGDRVERRTALRAESTGEFSWGVELGPLGTLTLRAVLPWMVNGERIGYLELGKEVLFSMLDLKRFLGVDFYLLVDKGRLVQGEWEQGMVMLGRQGAWGHYRQWVLSAATGEAPPLLGQFVNSGFVEQEPRLLLHRLGWDARGEEQVHFVTFALPGVDGQEPARVVATFPETMLRSVAERHLVVVMAVVLVVALVLGYLFYQVLRRVEGRLRRTEHLLEENRERLTRAQRVAHFGNLEWQVQEGTIYCSDELARILGWNTRTLPISLRRLLRRVTPLDRGRVIQWLRGVLAGAHVEQLELWIKRPDGGERFVLVQSAVSRAPTGALERLVITLHDQTEQRLAVDDFRNAAHLFEQAISEAAEQLRALRGKEEELAQQAMLDPLTGLGNRRCFSHIMEQVINLAQGRERGFAILLVDVDHFKVINDTLGHAIGDLVLREVADRLLKGLRTSDQLFRLGGDEFVALLPECHDMESAEQVAQRLLQETQRPVEVDRQALGVTISMGIALWPQHANALGALLDRADQALYWVKRNGRNGVKVYAPTLAVG